MAGITLGRAIDIFSREIGAIGSDFSRDRMIDDITAAIEYMLLNGGGNILREWVVPVSRDGRTTLPRDLATPVKYKYSIHPNSGRGDFATAFYPYNNNSIPKCCDYFDWSPSTFYVNPHKVTTSFQPPRGGGRLVATTRSDDDVGKKIMVSGKSNGMEIAPLHNGFKTAGELLTIYHEDDSDKKYSAYSFDEITHITKDLTCDYVMLSGISNSNNEPFFLSHYHPDEQTPQYTEIRAMNCPSCDSGSSPLLHILGKVEPTTRYLRDEDLLPISSESMLQFLALRAMYLAGGNFNERLAIEGDIAKLIRAAISYQQPPKKSMSVNFAGSGSNFYSM